MTLEDLSAEAEIRRVLGRYQRGCDRLDLEMVKSCYFDDATEDRGRYVGGLDGFIEWLGGMLEGFRSTWHLFGDPLIEIDGDVAYVETYSLGLHQFDGGDGRPERGRLVPTRYCDRFESRAGEWRIARRIAVYEGSFEVDADPTFSSPPRSSRDKNDPSYLRDSGDPGAEGGT